MVLKPSDLSRLHSPSPRVPVLAVLSEKPIAIYQPGAPAVAGQRARERLRARPARAYDSRQGIGPHHLAQIPAKLREGGIAGTRCTNRPDSPMDYCFDTSAVNELNDDPERDVLLKGLHSAGSSHITAYNVVEVCATKSKHQRTALLFLLKSMGNAKFFGVPEDILKRLALRHAGTGSPSRCVEPEDRIIREVLADPSGVEPGVVQDIAKWKKEREDELVKLASHARVRFQKLFVHEPRPPNEAAWVRHCLNNPGNFSRQISRLYNHYSGARINDDRLTAFLVQYPQWSLYLLAIADAVYRRAIREARYGKTGKAGDIDLTFAVYLPSCDRFVTADTGQRKTLRLLSVVNNTICRRKTEVISYRQFRSRLLAFTPPGRDSQPVV